MLCCKSVILFSRCFALYFQVFLCYYFVVVVTWPVDCQNVVGLVHSFSNVGAVGFHFELNVTFMVETPLFY